MLRQVLVWTCCCVLAIKATDDPDTYDYPRPPPTTFWEINQELENEEKSTRNANCPVNVKGCAGKCLAGYVLDENGCETCKCRTSGTMDSDIKVDERVYDLYTALYGTTECGKVRGASNSERLMWPKSGSVVNVAYKFDSSVDFQKRTNIRNAIKVYDENTCIRFIEYSGQQDYLNIVGTGGCSSYVGRVGGGQQVSIGQNCDINQGTILHEFMHALGFWHEQSRGDRDNHVIIVWDNIRSGAEINFQKQEEGMWNAYGSPYDLGSVMHYGGFAFSKSRTYGEAPTILDRTTNQPVTSQRQGFSEEDIKQINRKYRCVGYKGYENGTPGTSTTTTPRITTTSSTTTVPPDQCFDIERNQCNQWKANGWCANNGYVQNRCVKTCTGCGGTTRPTTPTTTTRTTTTTTPTTTTGNGRCVDKYNQCEDWVAKNYCNEKFIQYMKDNCPKACGYCRTTTAPTTEPTPSSTTTSSCQDKRATVDCKRWQGQGLCTDSRFATFMSRNCKKTCGQCGSIVTTVAACKDKTTRCKSYAKQNFCTEQFVSYMRKNCRESCGLCGTTEATISITQPTPTMVTYNGQCGVPAVERKDDDDTFLQRIVGGTDAVYGTTPWIISLRQNNNFDFCGGTLISKQWVVTAAHCFFNNGRPDPSKSNGNIFGYLGVNHRRVTSQDVGQMRVSFSKREIHPNYDDYSSDNDIALLKLQQPVTEFTTYIRPACLPSLNENFNDGLTGLISGWGATQSGDYDANNILQEVDVFFINREMCNQWLGPRSGKDQVTSNMFCAGHEFGGKDACQGDSGGPLVVERNGRYILAGVTSWGYGCAQRRRPGVYTKVPVMVDWINQVMQRN
ncbi:uncharacterized protein LOC143469186 [Clavelina lepadiformis]|uniref:Metalloendopeptidase n=1 Tax=Clavelina lepadiformis TaxID=159417 RepID=A0ABP0FWY9_CLALP